jgi:hypothetical protein
MTSHVPDFMQLVWLGLIAGAILVRPLHGAIVRRRFRRVVARRLRWVLEAA